MLLREMEQKAAELLANPEPEPAFKLWQQVQVNDDQPRRKCCTDWHNGRIVGFQFISVGMAIVGSEAHIGFTYCVEPSKGSGLIWVEEADLRPSPVADEKGQEHG